MLNAAAFAGHFARAVELFRDPTAKDAQKAAFRALVGLVQATPVTVRVENHRLLVNGTQVTNPGVETLAASFSLHGVAEVTIPAGAPVQQVFELLKALADAPVDADHVPGRLRATGSFDIAVSTRPHDTQPRRPAPPLPPKPPPPPQSPALMSDAAGGLLRGDPMSELRSVRISGASDVTQVPVSESDDVATPTTGRARIGASAYDRDAVEEPLPPPAPPRSPSPPPVRTAAPPHAPPARPRSADDMLESLSALGRQVETLSRAGSWEKVLTIMTQVVADEQGQDAAGRRLFGITLKRMGTSSVLREIARLAVLPKYEQEGLAVLRRFGGDGTDVMLDLLIGAEDIGIRRAAFNAVKTLGKGTDKLLALFNHRGWFVVRQAAELVGEMQLESAVPSLAGALSHSDERVRKAVALALAKIGTPSTVDPVRRALRDPDPGVRQQVAIGIGGRQASALAMIVVVAMEEEKDPEVERELTLALGRIGSPDAVQALIKLALPAGMLFNRKPSTKRVAAVEGLRLAGTPAAVGALQGLAGDGDKQVRAAAQDALQAIKPKG